MLSHWINKKKKNILINENLEAQINTIGNIDKLN